jgi:peptidoglycan/LPS O-acetylase OafA/YrhL
MKYRAYVDGLRAVAILPVLAYHAGLGTPGGFVGVDIFFVISGFLITGLILKDLDVGRFNVFEFWERRIRRILPALAVVILATLVGGAFLFLPQDFKDLGLSAMWQATLAANFYFWHDSGYFTRGADVKPLLHTWSLAVEEQLYLIFPFLLIIIGRFARKRLVPAILLLGLISLGLSLRGTYVTPNAAFYLLPSRAWELLAGALLAALPPQKPSARWVSELASYSGLAAIAYAVFFYTSQTRFPGAAALLPCLGTVLLLRANGHTLTSVGTLLAWPPIVFIGLISYPLYLWHWPLLVFSRYWALGELPLAYRLLILGASVALAALSWRFVEAPFRKRLVLKSRPRVFVFAVTVLAILFLSGFAVNLGQGLPSRFSPEALQLAGGATDRAFRENLTADQARRGEFAELGDGDRSRPVRLVLWGDSHAMAVAPVIDALCKEHSVRGAQATHSSSAPLIDYVNRAKYSLGEDSTAFSEAVIEFIRKNRVGDVVLVCNWPAHDDGTGEFQRRLLATTRKLEEVGARVWIMKTVPRQAWSNVPRALALAAMYGGEPEELGRPLAEHLKAVQRQSAVFETLGAPTVSILDPTELLLSPKGLCRAALNGHSLYADQGHLTVHGAMVLRPLFEPLFKHMDGSP